MIDNEVKKTLWNAVDTNVLIYVQDPRDPIKQAKTATLIKSLPDGVLLWQVANEYIAASRKLGPFGYNRPQAFQDLTNRRKVWTTILPTWAVLDKADCVMTMTQAFALCCTLNRALAYREEVAFFQAIRAALNKHSTATKKLSDEQREDALRQIVSRAVFSDGVIDIFAAAGLKKPNIGILSEEFLNDVRLMPQRNLAVELLERLLQDEIKSRFATNVLQNKKFSGLLVETLTRYHNRAVETAQVIEELIASEAWVS